jgi:CheY-like chemotaxis protein
LIVEDDEVQRNSIIELIGNGDVESTAVASGAEAIELLKERHFDCMVIDLGLPDMTGYELIKRIQDELGLTHLPIVVYTGKDLTSKEELELRKMTEAVIVKEAKSPDRLLDETALFLHRVEKNLPEGKRKMLEQAHNRDPILSGRKILVVDDDVRNIFALTSILEGQNMQVSYAENGLDAIAKLKEHPDTEVVLMDVMMPEIDGYETTRRIREIEAFANLPIIALTAKAMKGDREKCIESGSSDYIAKPVDTEQLMSLLRVWLYQ